MKVSCTEAVYEVNTTRTTVRPKRSFRSVEKNLDGTEVRLRKAAHEIRERIVVGYDQFGRAVYGTSLRPQHTFEVRDSKECDPEKTAP